MCNQLGRITASRMNFVSLLFDFKFAFIRCSRSLLHFVKNKKLLPKVYCFKMLIMQNIFFRIKKKTFIYETAHVTSRQNFCPITVSMVHASCTLRAHTKLWKHWNVSLQLCMQILHTCILQKFLMVSDCCRSYNN